MSGNVRPESMERITTLAQAEAFIEEQVKEVRAQVGDKKVLLALSHHSFRSLSTMMPTVR